MTREQEAYANPELVDGSETTLHSHAGGSGGISKGTSFPGSPSDGDFYYRTDLDHLFHYDSGRGKWLGELDWEGGGTNGTCSGYTKRFNGMSYSSTRGVLIPWDVTVVGLSWNHNAAVSGVWEVHRDGSTVVAVTASDKSGSDMTLNADFAADGVFALYNSGSSISYPQVRVWFRRHAT